MEDVRSIKRTTSDRKEALEMIDSMIYSINSDSELEKCIYCGGAAVVNCVCESCRKNYTK